MKKFLMVLGLSLLTLTVVATGCTQTAPTPAPTTPPAAPAPVQITEGPLTAVSPEKDTVTVTTPTGPQTFEVTPQTSITFQGQACTLDQLAELESSGEDFDCTVVYDAEGNVAALNVFRVTPQATSFRGTISDVNLTESTITVKTAEGDKVMEVDPETGLLIGGTACSLELVNAILESNANTPSAEALECTVIASTDQQGKALYVDIASPPNLTLGTGTIEAISVEKSTVTIETDKGPRTFEVDAKTNAFLNGAVCSLDDVLAATEVGGSLSSCEVMFFTNEAGDLVYLDISKPATLP